VLLCAGKQQPKHAPRGAVHEATRRATQGRLPSTWNENPQAAKSNIADSERIKGGVGRRGMIQRDVDKACVGQVNAAVKEGGGAVWSLRPSSLHTREKEHESEDREGCSGSCGTSDGPASSLPTGDQGPGLARPSEQAQPLQRLELEGPPEPPQLIGPPKPPGLSKPQGSVTMAASKGTCGLQKPVLHSEMVGPPKPAGVRQTAQASMVGPRKPPISHDNQHDGGATHGSESDSPRARLKGDPELKASESISNRTGQPLP
jgi:hypothetical protein